MNEKNEGSKTMIIDYVSFMLFFDSFVFASPPISTVEKLEENESSSNEHL